MGRDRQVVIRAGAGILVLMLLMPLASALVDSSTTIPVSRDLNAQDSPATIALLKHHVAFVGVGQDARMDGVIRYIDNISRGTAITNLQQIQDDYLVIAASIPLMHTSDDISKARDSLRVQTQLFSEETRAQMVKFSGSNADMRESIRSSTDTADKVIARAKDSLWLANESARLTLFSQESVRRSIILTNLSQRSNLRSALSNQSVAALANTNDAIKTLNRQFRDNVASSRTALAIETKSREEMART
jgi:hypothetical protein